MIVVGYYCQSIYSAVGFARQNIAETIDSSRVDEWRLMIGTRIDIVTDCNNFPTEILATVIDCH